MKTKNIFRMLLVIATLLFGTNNIMAGEHEVEFQGNYNYQGDNYVADKSEFSDLQEGSTFRIYVSNYKEQDGWKLYICGGVSAGNGISYVDPGFENWNKVDISWYTYYDNSQGYKFNGQYFEFICTSTTVSVFQTHGLFIDNDWKYNIDLITYTTDAPTVEKYAVNLPTNLTGGTVTASPGRQEKDKTVTLTITPNLGYEIGTVSVKDANDNEVSLDGSGNTRTFTMPGSAVTVTATFNAIDYTVSTASGISVNNSTAHFGETITITTGSVPDGYELAGVTVKDANNQNIQVSNNQFTMPASNVTVSALYKIVVSASTTATTIWGPSSKAIDWWENRIEYSTSEFTNAKVGDIIRIKGSMGNADTYFNVKLNDMQIPNWGYSDLTAQWTSEEDGYIDAVISQDMLNQLQNNQTRNLTGFNFTVTEIQWLYNDGEIVITPTHTLTISIDGQMQTMSVAEGTTLTNVLPTPAKEGYTFTGWSGIPDNGQMGTENLTVTAQFSINSYKLTYKVDGEVSGDVETIEYGATITPRTAPTKDGFTFSGWNGLPETMPAHDVEVTGEFTANKYKVEFASTPYGTITTDKESYEKGETVTVTIAANTGYHMESISTNPTDLGLQRVDDGVFSFTMPDADVTVTVRFGANEYTLTFMLNGEEYIVNEIPQVYNVKYGTSITLPVDPAVEEGYAFSGWNGIPEDGTMPAGDLTVYGHFIATLAVGSTGYATYCPKKPLIFQGNEAIKAYIAKEKSDTEVTLIQVIGAVAAGTGLVLMGEADTEAEFEVTNEGTDYSETNLLIGVTDANVTIRAANQYVLVQKTDGVKFADTAANPATVPVGKAYLQAPANSSRILTIGFANETTSLEAVRTLTDLKTDVYNLNGQRISIPRKGLYIVNGKKAYIK